MPDISRIMAELEAAIRHLKNRGNRLTPFERMKLKSLLLNLEVLQKQPRSNERTTDDPDSSLSRLLAAEGCFTEPRKDPAARGRLIGLEP